MYLVMASPLCLYVYGIYAEYYDFIHDNGTVFVTLFALSFIGIFLVRIVEMELEKYSDNY